ncbi:Monofunctional biosynthetic peptidoglycan transglycosylase [Rubellimicrobium mesophilum DSM 19309]|uniref:Biosynthetic peptidoglycan transglycosylase n=1 Tax=Rubellimicrobium mesophilum DSM 19309 TaxID=442562 RepID=A0A017HLL6_9RHOB|nr:monofunctional biosynthetic peptidoglycan transglycosylase [Rubellimicrobium mesophilum]EYD74664.1 Monofunctional biosynthetic peptidoglycan transglycosylase [Rubellimicrobium mesophilum DSM 19309]
MARAAGSTAKGRARLAPEPPLPEDEAAAPPPPKPRRSRAPKPPPEPLLDEEEPEGLGRRFVTFLVRGVLLLVVAVVGLVALFSVVNPPTDPYMMSESRRLGGIEQDWVSLDDVAPIMPRAAVAAEDANFCEHWGLDLRAIRTAMAQGSDRGASTISQQVVKNVFLWQGRSWTRKALEAGLTPVMEAFWTKRRILEVYLNVAEFGEGVFGVEAAARHWFGVPASDLTEVQAARLAAILPSPKTRDPANPTDSLRARARSILDGAATIEADGRAACFEEAASP